VNDNKLIYYHKSTRRIKLFVVGGIFLLISFLAAFALYKSQKAENAHDERGVVVNGKKSDNGLINSDVLSDADVGLKNNDLLVTRKSEIITPRARDCDNYEVNVEGQSKRSEPVGAIGEVRKKITGDLLKGATEMDRAAGAFFFLRNQRYVAFNDCTSGVCDSNAEQKFDFENQSMLNTLVQLAATTKSSDIYLWALNACSSGSAKLAPENSCSALSRQKATELDSDNVWPWLALASEFMGKGNMAGVEESLFRAANATRWTSASAEFSKLLTPRIALVQDSVVAFGLLNELKTMSTEMRLSALNTISVACPANADENRKQVCKKLASNLLANSTDLASLSVSLKVGDRVGVSALDLKSKQDEYAKLQPLLPSKVVMTSGNALEGCKAVRPVISFLESSLQNGEIVALTQLMKQEQK
jgi:hypothetical protein